MSVTLLALKKGTNFLRVRGGECAECGIEGASVYPETSAESLEDTLASLQGRFPEARIVRLVLTEEEYRGDRP